MESPESGPVNLGNPHEVTVGDLAGRILGMIPGTGSDVTYEPLPKDDPTRRRPDITLAEKLLDWEPKVPLETGLERTIEYFRGDLCCDLDER
jgi:nucleoside-diphosphate-sugar epimerase